jgi:hypothetical protein
MRVSASILKSKKAAYKKALKQALYEIGVMGLKSVYGYNGFRGTKLKQATKFKTNQACTKLTFTNTKKYASFVNNGRGMVFPKNKKCLRFKINGKVIFTKSSKATTPKPFFDDAVKVMDHVGQGIMDRHFNAVFAKG